MELALAITFILLGVLSGVVLFVFENWNDLRDTVVGSVIDDVLVLPLGKLYDKVFGPSKTSSEGTSVVGGKPIVTPTVAVSSATDLNVPSSTH